MGTWRSSEVTAITDEWLGDAQDRKHFADLSVRVRGPLVNAIQSAFS